MTERMVEGIMRIICDGCGEVIPGIPTPETNPEVNKQMAERNIGDLCARCRMGFFG